MSRIAMANQCRRIKPAEPHDSKQIVCQRERGHQGPHSSGKYYRWTDTYHQEKARKG